MCTCIVCQVLDYPGSFRVVDLQTVFQGFNLVDKKKYNKIIIEEVSRHESVRHGTKVMNIIHDAPRVLQ